MKVSSKIYSGFLLLMLLAIVVLANELQAIHQMQAVNQELSEINLNSAKTVIKMQRLADLLRTDYSKYFVRLDPDYVNHVADDRAEFLKHVVELSQTAKSAREQTVLISLREAVDDFWLTFDRLKEQIHDPLDPEDLPQELIMSLNHLEAKTDEMLDAVQLAIKERVGDAAAVGKSAERLSRVAGIFSLVLGAIVAIVIVRSINEPLRRLTQGTRVIAKGEFGHRLPADGTDEFGEVARDFNVMVERLGELDQMKRDFVSHVSHDLKAPLASIRQIMHLLLQEIPGTLNDQQKDLIQLSYNSAERLASMVANLLDVSRLEAGTMEYQMASHDVVPVINAVADEFAVQAREKDIRFRLECDVSAVFAECDRDRIVQVIGNLYENALKFSPAHSEIVTRVGPGKGKEILISVTDSGPGVPNEHKERVFRKFHQVKQGKKLAGQGVGLGLAICKTIVEAHGGHIWVEDNPNGGSVFSFVLKAAAREEVLTCGQSA